MFGIKRAITPKRILTEYLKWKSMPSGLKRGEFFKKLVAKVREQKGQDALYDLVFSPQFKRLDTSIQEPLIWLGGHGGSVAKSDNQHWSGFIARVRERKEELPEEVQNFLDWLLEVHGY